MRLGIKVYEINHMGLEDYFLSQISYLTSHI